MANTPDDIRSKLSSKFQNKLIKASEVKDERLELASVSLTKALDGGLCYGAVSVLMGNTGSGKTALALQSAGRAMVEHGKTVAMIDAEKSFKPSWGRKMGIPVDDMLWTKVGDIANASEMCVELIDAGTDIIIVDSISTLATSNIVDKEGNVLGFNDNNQLARRAVELEQMVNTLNFVNENTAIIFISQIRNTITSMGARGFHAAGGKAMEHMPTTNVALTSSQSSKEFITDDVFNGKTMIEKPIGRHVAWDIKKHRGAGAASNGKYDFYFDGPNLGVDSVGELVDMAVLYGEIVRGGSWFTLPNGDRFQGKPKVVAYYKDHLDEYEILKASVLS